MNLNDFENYIEKKIIERGRDYYINGYVLSLEEVDENVYEAEVEGTELYNVEVVFDDKLNIIDSLCDCPYDLGEYCKHQVAVFLALRDTIRKASGRKSSVNKKKAVDIRKVLTETPKDKLVEFLFNIALEYREIKRLIELNFAIENDDDEINKSIALIRAYIKSNSDRSGYVDYRNTYEAVKGAELVLEKAYGTLERNRIKQALDLALCVIHEMMVLLDCADDSDGIIGGVIEQSFDLISRIIEDEELSPADKESIFDKLFKEASNRQYESWTDWRLNLLGYCSELANTPVLRNKLDTYFSILISKENEDSWSSNYLAERIELIKYHMAEQYEGQANLQEFIEKNIKYNSFRKMAIENAIKEQNYECALRLVLEGEEQDKGLPGLVKQWKEYRYRIYEQSGRLDEQREIAIEFILNGSYEYYKELKKTYSLKEWADVCSKVICLLEAHKKTYQDIYTSILVEEGKMDKLLEYIRHNPSSVERFYKHLVPEFSDEVFVLFRKYIEYTAANVNSRHGYKRVCDIIRNLKKAGGEEQAQEIKAMLIAKYANRPAFRDELSRI